MRESLEILGVKSSELDEIDRIGPRKKVDSDIFQEIENLSKEEKEQHLRKVLKKNPPGLIKAKQLLVKLIKNKDLKLAFELILSACLFDPIDPENYFVLAEVAYENNAYLAAKESLEITEWLSGEKTINVDNLLSLVNKKIQSKERDNSYDIFWRNRTPDRGWVLEKLYLQNETQKLIDYSFKLLKLFPDNDKTYDAIYKVFSYSKDKSLLLQFIEHLKKNLENKKLIQNLYLGAAYYTFNDFSLAKTYLNEALKINPLSAKSLLYLTLAYLQTSDMENFKKTFEFIIPEFDPQFSAVFFIYSAFTTGLTEDTEFPNHQKVASQVGKITDKLLDNNQIETVNLIIEQFQKFNFHKPLPYYQLYFAEVFIKHKLIDKAKDILKDCINYEAHRLMAWIHRIEGNKEQAEQELCKFRKNWIPDREKGVYCKAVPLKMPQEPTNNTQEMFKIIKNAYEETSSLIKNFATEYGLNLETCMETGCQDCCNITFPLATYTEYLYFKDWFDKQSIEYKNQMKEESQKIMNYYRERYKKEPTFIVGENVPFTNEYPLNFNFACPFLGNNKCDVYEVRPFACRAYGFSTHDGVTFKGCTYFFEQFKAATNMNHTRKVLDARSFYNYAKLSDENLIGAKILAPLPRWFAQEHEETIQKVKEAIIKSRINPLSLSEIHR